MLVTQPLGPKATRLRGNIRLPVCRCLTGAVRSASRIASITGSSGPSFGFGFGPSFAFATGLVRV